MNTPDLITIIGNVSRSLIPVQHLISGASYIVGILFVTAALIELRGLAQKGNSQEGAFPAIAFFCIGAALLFLPSTIETLANTVFGSNNILSYVEKSPFDIYASMRIVVQTIGALWFVRGCVLVAEASKPGKQHGAKGFVFIFAGILAVNFTASVSMANYVIDNLVSMSISVKKSQGF